MNLAAVTLATSQPRFELIQSVSLYLSTTHGAIKVRRVPTKNKCFGPGKVLVQAMLVFLTVRFL